jgi:hypothetical protein
LLLSPAIISIDFWIYADHFFNLRHRHGFSKRTAGRTDFGRAGPFHEGYTIPHRLRSRSVTSRWSGRRRSDTFPIGVEDKVLGRNLGIQGVLEALLSSSN